MYKKIFVSNRAGIGDVILTTPVLKALKEKYPASKIIFMIGPNCLEVVKGLPFIDEIITYDKKEDSIWKVVKKAWRSDIALCLDFKYRTPLLALLSGIPIRAGLKHKRKILLTHSIDKAATWEETYEPINYANVILESTGISLKTDWNTLYLPERSLDDKKYITALLSEQGIGNDEKFFVICPFTSWLPKDWPLAYYEQLIGRLNESFGRKIVLIGTTGDRERAAALTVLPHVVNLMGQTTLLQMAEVLERAALLIGGCSASLHMAAATKTPFVAMYGATSPKRWAPRTTGTVLYKGEDLPCSPCNGPMTGCKEKPCQYNITVEEVHSTCLNLLKV